MKVFSELKKNLKKDFSHLKPVKVALLGDTATQLLSQAIRAAGYDKNLNLDIWEAGFDQIEQEIQNASSELFEFKPELIIIYQSSQKLLEKYNKLKPEAYIQLAAGRMEMIDALCKNIEAKLRVPIIYYNYTEIDDGIFGNYANQVEPSFLFQLRKLNHDLMLYSVHHPQLHICDLSGIQNRSGKSWIFQPSIYIQSEMGLSIDSLPWVAERTLALIRAILGHSKKCLILDLDNTVWGGILGDDGMENIQIGSLGIGKAFTAFQYWVKKLKNRGIIIAVCSKNTESLAKEPFEKHPDMILRLEDIAVFKANWDSKMDNIQQIQQVLNISYDSMVFLDDDPLERNLIREHIPDIAVPELPPDPADYLEYLCSLDLFETVSLSTEDAERTKRYQTEARRDSERQHYFDEDVFLKNLHMTSAVEAFNKFNGPRVSQLSNRSNQFNLRTVRYSQAEIDLISRSPGHFTFSFSLEDKYGDSGLVSMIILKKETLDTLFIDTWLMSCRVLKRGMEAFVLNTLADFGKTNGFRYLKGEYIATPKNEMVKDHYPRLGFVEKDGFWVLDLNLFTRMNTHVNLQ
jgi:FkbH-like protein